MSRFVTRRLSRFTSAGATTVCTTAHEQSVDWLTEPEQQGTLA